MLLLVSAAFAVDAEFITVVGDDAHPSDVVTAANFAATMKRDLGVTFTGRTESQIDEIPTKEVIKTTLVVIDENEVEVIQGQDAPRDHGKVSQHAFAYFSSNGFTVDMSIGEFKDASEIEIKSTRPPCEGCKVGDSCYDFGTVRNGEYCGVIGMTVQKENGSTCNNDYECLTGECHEGSCGMPVVEVPEPREIVEPPLQEPNASPPPADEPAPEEPEPGLFGKIWGWFTGLFG